MPSNLSEPPGMAPASGDATLSPLRRWRDDHGELVAERRAVIPGPVIVGDGTPEPAPARRVKVPVMVVPMIEREDGR